MPVGTPRTTLIQSQKDLTQVLRSFKKAEKQRTPTLPVLILNFLDGFAPELTVKQLYPFLLHSKVLILCGNVPPAELPQLPLHGEDLSALLADPDVGICVSKLSCLLFYSINQLLSYRALRLNRWMIFASMCGFCGTPNTNFYLNKGYPIIEYPGKLREAWLNNHPDMIPAYCRYINQNMNRYRKASKRLDTLLKPFQTCCGAQFSSKSLPAKVRPWKERLYTALLLDYILNHPLSRPLTAPVAGNVFKTWLYAIVPPKQRPAQKCSLRLFSSFVDFVRHASMAVSKDAYVSVALLFLKDNLLENFYHQTDTPDAEICLYETTLELLLEQVAEGQSEFGLAVVNDHQLPVFTRMSQARSLEVTPLDQAQSPQVHVHRSHPLAQHSEIYCRQLFEFPRLLPPGDFFSHLNQIVQETVDRPENPARRTIVVNSCHTMLRMLHRTPGYMIGNIWQAQELACSGIASIPLCDAPVQQNLMLVRRQRQRLSPCAHLFLTDFLKDQGLPAV